MATYEVITETYLFTGIHMHVNGTGNLEDMKALYEQLVLEDAAMAYPPTNSWLWISLVKNEMIDGKMTRTTIMYGKSATYEERI